MTNSIASSGISCGNGIVARSSSRTLAIDSAGNMSASVTNKPLWEFNRKERKVFSISLRPLRPLR
jgi:hypothetical protein